MQILDNRQIDQKVKRLAIEILEHNYTEEEIILVGINNNGLHFAQLIMSELLLRTTIPITLTRVRLNPANPTEHEIKLEMPVEDMQNKVVIVIDDVANTGRTIFYAIMPLMSVVPKKVEVAVLVDREHKSFPIAVDYVGLSLATTLQENIDVRIKNLSEKAAFLS
jgi:pyrimidine operon attenuation protein / uracil phosphoribosyltransferase